MKNDAHTVGGSLWWSLQCSLSS